MADNKVITERDIPFRQVKQVKIDRQNNKKEGNGLLTTAAKIAISTALTGDPSGSIISAIVGGVVDDRLKYMTG